MAKIISIINQFDLGMFQDPRVKNSRYAQLIKGFDAHTYPFKLTPFYSSQSGDGSASTNKIQNFTRAKYAANDYRDFGLGVVSGGTKATIFVNASLTSPSWSALTNGVSTTGTSTDFELFAYYPKTGRIYGARDGTTIWCVDPADGVAFDETTGADAYAHALATAYLNPRSASATNRPYICGLVHSKDDILYIAYDNIIIKNNGTTWTDPALTLPTNRIITSICEYGNYLAIATKPLGEVGGSRVYLWDRDSSLATISESIDWGEGNLHILEEIDGILVGVSISGTTGSVLYSRITFRYYAGGKPIVFKQFISEAVYLSNDLPRAKRKVNNYLYFFLTITLNGTKQEGLWKVGKHISSGEFIVTMDRTPNNTTALVSGELHNFLMYGDVVYISYTTSGALAMSLTYTTTVFAATAIYESVIFGNQYQNYKLINVGVMTQNLPSGTSLTLGYKKDSDTSYTSIFTYSTLAGIYHEAVNIESSGATLPQFREISFQISSTGAVITGLRFTYEEIKNNPSD